MSFEDRFCGTASDRLVALAVEPRRDGPRECGCDGPASLDASKELPRCGLGADQEGADRRLRRKGLLLAASVRSRWSSSCVIGCRIVLEPDGCLGSYGVRGGGGGDLRPLDALEGEGGTSSLARPERVGSGDQFVGGGGREVDVPELLLLPRGCGRSPGRPMECEPGDADMLGERRGAL